MICDNIRPYVDHGFPAGGAGAARKRAEAMLRPDFQRRLKLWPGAPMVMSPSSLFVEWGRREAEARAQRKEKATATAKSRL